MVTERLSAAGGLTVEPNLMYFGLLVGATLGGNLTPIGASANITGIGILRKEGYSVSSGTFMKFGVPLPWRRSSPAMCWCGCCGCKRARPGKIP